MFVLIGIVIVCVGVGIAIGAGLAKSASASSVVEETDKPITSTIVPTQTAVTTTSEIVEEVFYFDIPLSHDLQDYIEQQCNYYDVPMELVIAMIDKESNFDEKAISSTNDYGLMQINICNHEWLNEDFDINDLLNPYQNVFSGIYILAGHLEKTDGDVEKALMRYNCGATGAAKLWSKGIYSTSYTEKIMTAYEFYKEESRPTESTQ